MGIAPTLSEKSSVRLALFHNLSQRSLYASHASVLNGAVLEVIKDFKKDSLFYVKLQLFLFPEDEIA